MNQERLLGSNLLNDINKRFTPEFPDISNKKYWMARKKEKLNEILLSKKFLQFLHDLKSGNVVKSISQIMIPGYFTISRYSLIHVLYDFINWFLKKNSPLGKTYKIKKVIGLADKIQLTRISITLKDAREYLEFCSTQGCYNHYGQSKRYPNPFILIRFGVLLNSYFIQKTYKKK